MYTIDQIFILFSKAIQMVKKKKNLSIPNCLRVAIQSFFFNITVLTLQSRNSVQLPFHIVGFCNSVHFFCLAAETPFEQSNYLQKNFLKNLIKDSASPF